MGTLETWPAAKSWGTLLRLLICCYLLEKHYKGTEVFQLENNIVSLEFLSWV